VCKASRYKNNDDCDEEGQEEENPYLCSVCGTCWFYNTWNICFRTRGDAELISGIHTSERKCEDLPRLNELNLVIILDYCPGLTNSTPSIPTRTPFEWPASTNHAPVMVHIHEYRPTHTLPKYLQQIQPTTRNFRTFHRKWGSTWSWRRSRHHGSSWIIEIERGSRGASILACAGLVGA
jgi:hypothetical protein